MDQYEKFNGYHKMDNIKKRIPDYTDIAYREAVARLRYLLAESYSSRGTPTKFSHTHSTKIEDSGDETDASAVVSDRSRHVSYRAPIFETKYNVYPGLAVKSCSQLHGPPTQLPATRGTASVASGDEPTSKASATQPPPELMAYIERQEEYIEQLEKESQYCREELSNLIGRVKDVISENEGLHEKEKSGLLKSVFESFESGEDEDDDDADTSDEKKEKKKMQPAKKKRLEGPSIVFESRISELEAQLTQTKIDLRKALEEVDMYKKKLADVQSHSFDGSSIPNIETYKHQIEILQREKEELKDNMAKLNMAVAQIREKEADATHKAKRTLDVADQAEFEKAQAEMEVRRLKEELDRQHEKLRDLLQEQGRKVQEERAAAERRYAQQVEQLSSDLAMQWDAVGKLQLELERERRIEADLRRELQQKNCTIEELKKELHTKIAGLQSEASQNAAERGSLEQELTSSRLMIERAEREARQEAARLQAEITALRQRLDRADGDLLHSRRENLRLSEQVASLERELNLAKMAKESATRDAGIRSSPSKQSGGREKELSSMIMDMEAKHVKTVAELEGMIQSQNLVMEKLREECHSLTKKLEDSSARHKEEKTALKGENVNLLGKLEQVWKNYKELQKENIKLNASDELSAEKEIQATHLERSKMKRETGGLKQDSMIHNKAMKNKSSTLPTNSMSNQKNMVTKQNSSSNSMKNSNLYNHSSSSSRINNNSNSIQNTEHTNLHMSKTQASSSLDHLLLSPWRREVAVPPLTLEDLATDSDSCGSQSAQLDIFK
ncbi:serologically defined colon cancer antigen 8 homolog isoform X1 [Schistocerca cancellata]|uniref:serologically defined colon cancer antigen 8 homolog isoform X1 n=1 Tax=Schistocerca cancellata TaxID=274614 RepID=UPI0021180655|nr:serologically defined colon cancer antigen 8 homolog isoform X1 [Schistocerca cancellata]